MRAVMLSIHPKWCELIVSGKKTIEVRRTRPKIETPFKCYIYETKAKTDVLCTGRGTVVGEFVCDEIEHFTKAFFDEQEERDTEEIAYFLEESCLSYGELCNYVKLDDFYAWHISELKIYDKPKEIEEFYSYSSLENYDFCSGCPYHEMPITEFPCNECKHDAFERKYLTRPPQSYMFVEEL